MGERTRSVSVDVHPTAIVDSEAELDEGVVVGAYSVIGPRVKIGRGTHIAHHVILDGETTFGNDNQVFSFAAIGVPSQSRKHDGCLNRLEIGHGNVIREYVTINPSDSRDGLTRIGNRNLLMASTHVAHDCVLGDGVIMANGSLLAGYVTVDDYAILGGLAAIHQMVRIGIMAIVGGCSKVVKDVIPYSKVDGHPTRCFGLNTMGLQRHHVSENSRVALKRAFRLLFRSNLNTTQALARIVAEVENCPEVQNMVRFIEDSSRGICK